MSSVTAAAPFAAWTNCASVSPGASCTVWVNFTPAAAGNASGTLTIASSAGTQAVALSGIGERPLVTHYYRSILRRAPDDGGKTFWNSEAVRVQRLGVNVNEVWFAMAQQFYTSAEYLAFNRDNAGFATDLFDTFFNRAPDQGGLDYWVGQLNQGMPREVVLTAYMFSTGLVDRVRRCCYIGEPPLAF